MFRRIAIGLCLLATLVVMIPLVTSTAHNLRSQFAAKSHHRRHSRAWWRRHRAMMRRRQAMLARRRAMLMARRNGVTEPMPKMAGNHATLSTAVAPVTTVPTTDSFAVLPSGWSAINSTNGTSSFRITPTTGPEANATLSVVAPTTGPEPFGREARNMVGGASFTDLRRTVIDRMISAGGWVVNDRQREIGGRKVFEVIAQTPANDGKPDQVWNFYFAEVNGRVYALTTRTAGNSDQVAADAEKFISTLSPAEMAKQKK